MFENTSLNMDDILSLTVSQLEYILGGFTKKNKKAENNDSNVLTGKAAIEALKKMGMDSKLISGGSTHDKMICLWGMIMYCRMTEE